MSQEEEVEVEKKRSYVEPSEETLNNVINLLGENGGGGEQRRKFQKKINNAISGSIEKVPQFAAGGQVIFYVTDVMTSRKNPSSSWRRIRGVVYGDQTDPAKTEVKIPYSCPGENTKKIQQCMEGALCKAMGVETPKRDSWGIPIGYPFEVVTFGDQGVKVGTLGWASGTMFELTPKEHYGDAEEDDSNETKVGDIIPEIRARYVNHYKNVSPQEAFSILSTKVMHPFPIHLLPHGGKVLPYPSSLKTFENEISWGKKSSRNTIVPFGIPNDVLFSHLQMKPSCLVHISNKYYRMIMDPPLDGEKFQEGGPIVCTTVIPETRDWLHRKVGVEGVEKPVIATPKDSATHGLYPINIADPRVDEEAKIFVFIWDQGVMDISGVQFAETWIKFGAQIIRGLDAVMEIVIDKRESLYDEDAKKFSLKGSSCSFPLVNLHETFRWCGAKVTYDQAYQMAHRSVLGKQWEQKVKRLQPWNGHAPQNAPMSTASLKLATNDKSVKIVCLAEVTGDMNQMFNREEWDFYAVPPSDLFSEPPGEYLELLGFYKQNDPSEFLASYGEKCAIFAIRKDVN